MIEKASKVVKVISILSALSLFSTISFTIIMQPSAGPLLAQEGNMNMNPVIMHIHPHLSIMVDDMPIEVPKQIGIDPSLWSDHSLDKFGMQSMPGMNMTAMAPIHTHDSSGIVHVESTINRDYTFGEFLNIWGLNLDGKAVEVTTDDKPLADFKEHILRDGETIKLEVQ